ALRHPVDARLRRPRAWPDAIPDETTILNFRRLLERHELSKTVFAAVAEHLEARGALLRGGTIMDATLIAVPPSSKYKAQKRDPEEDVSRIILSTAFSRRKLSLIRTKSPLRRVGLTAKRFR